VNLGDIFFSVRRLLASLDLTSLRYEIASTEAVFFGMILNPLGDLFVVKWVKKFVAGSVTLIAEFDIAPPTLIQ